MPNTNLAAEIIHESNPNILPFLPPVSELPEFNLTVELLRGNLNLTTFLFEKIQKEHSNLDKIAIEFDGCNLSYGQLIARTYSIANSLYSRGLKGGDRTLVLLDFTTSFIESMLGVLLTGAIACQDIPHVHSKVQHLVKTLAPKYVFVDANVTSPSLVLDNSDDAFVVVANPKSEMHFNSERVLYLEDFLATPATFSHVSTKGGTIATMFHTSGSTGVPKGCVTTHASFVQICATSHADPIPFSSLKRGDKYYHNTPASGWGFYAAIVALAVGGALVFAKAKDIPAVMSSLSRGAAFMATTPSMYNKLKRHILDNPKEWEQCASKLRGCIIGGESHSVHFANSWKAASGVDLLSQYGTTETNAAFGYSTRSVVAGAVGKPFTGTQVQIFDVNFNPVPVDTPGLLAFKAFGGCIYWNNQEKQSYYVHNGWNIPRDICRMDKDGNIWFIGREDDLIIVQSYVGGNASAIELEGIVQTDSRVVEVAVVGKRTSETREDGKTTLITAFVVTSTNRDAELASLKKELKALVENHSKFTLDAIEFIEALPKLPNGKLNRNFLK
eukprot:Phypoly_transcript_06548.p1 GENE.Phypoly_transcript_06548~~Phypoly_transcript_06548.p1  ORF type:complete len:557 (-),score=57.20 Phypoly_transcript_06548:20-1690(-)